MNKTIHPITNIPAGYADRYIIYTRRSTDDPDNQKNSIEYQQQEAIRYYQRLGLPIADIAIEGLCTDGIVKEYHSGFKENDFFEASANNMVTFKVERPKFLSLVSLLRQRKFKGVIALCWDRFSRNETDDVLIKKLMSQGVDIRFVQTEYDRNSSAGALHMDIDGMFSRQYSRAISEKVRNTNKKLRAEGKCIYTPPLGYLSAGSDSKPFDPERAPLVKQVFKLYATGEWSFTTLAQWANKHGLTTKPTRRRRTRGEKLEGIQLSGIPKISNPVTEKTIYHILNNPFYIGKIRHKGELFDSKAHLPLIDLSTFYKVQAVLKQKAVKVYYPVMNFFTYRGLVKCAVCKRAYSPYVQKNIVYYRSRCKAGCTNTVKNVNEALITKEITAILNRIYFTDTELLSIEASKQKGLDAITDKRSRQFDDLMFRKNKARENLDYLQKEKLNLLRTGVFTPAQLIEEEGRLMELVREIDEQIAELNESAQSMLMTVVSFSELIKHAAAYYEYALDTEKRDIAIQVFSELYLENGKLKYEAKQGFNALLQRFDACLQTTCGEDYVFLELEHIYHLVKHDKKILEQYINSFLSKKSQGP